MLSANKIEEIKEQAFLGLPSSLDNICKVYPLKIPEIVEMGTITYNGKLGLLLLTLYILLLIIFKRSKNACVHTRGKATNSPKELEFARTLIRTRIHALLLEKSLNRKIGKNAVWLVVCRVFYFLEKGRFSSIQSKVFEFSAKQTMLICL